jgi:hypothetical protein
MNALPSIRLFCLFFATNSLLAVDQNTNQQSDIWEILYGVPSLSALADADKMAGQTGSKVSLARIRSMPRRILQARSFLGSRHSDDLLAE